MELSKLKVALVHDWLNGMRGGEKVLEYFCELFPNATIYTLHSELDKISEKIKKLPIKHSFIQSLPFKNQFYRHYLPLFPLAIKQFNFSNYDLIISTSHCAVKNVTIPNNIPHICFCFSPMRYIWSLQTDYFGTNKIKKLFLTPMLNLIKSWDLNGSKTVTQFIAISKTIQKRIKDAYNRDSILIYPPTDIKFTPIEKKSDYFLVLSALTPYKKIDQTILACNKLKIPLKVAGSGPLLKYLKKLAGPTIEFSGWVDDKAKESLLKNAKALLFPGFEDFGIVPLEAMAFATPVIGYNAGGLAETVTHEKTGLLYKNQTIEDIINTIQVFDNYKFNNEDFKKTIEKFSPENFISQLKETIITSITF